MPVWNRASKTFIAFARRWGLNAPTTEMWTGVVPTAQIDKHWTEDRLDLFGIEMQHGGFDPNGSQLASCSLVVGSKEALVHRVSVTYNGTVANRTLIGHLFTPLQGYNPATSGPSLVFPWLQPVQPPEPGRLAQAVGITGSASGVQVVTVNGQPHNSVGPTIQMGVNASSRVMWDSQDPPLRIKPAQLLTFQALITVPTGNTINVSFFWTERESQGDVG